MARSFSGRPSVRRLSAAAVLSITAMAMIAIGPATSAAEPPDCGEPAASGDSFVVRCTYTGSDQSFTVPSGVSSLHVVATAGTGQGNQHLRGGRGAVVTADIPVVPGTTLYVVVGGNGVSPGMGFNGGGPGGSSSMPGGRGGGASDVRTCTLQPSRADTCDMAKFGTSDDPRLIVAGGGGGQGQDVARGGDGGTPIGGDGEAAASGAQGGGGGTLSNGGTGGATAPISGLLAVQENGHPGVAGAGGAGGEGLAGGGGGGGGFFGGGGGGSGNGRFNGGGILSGGGGGGSSYVVPTAMGVSFAVDTTATPSVTITYSRPSPSAAPANLTVTDRTASTVGLRWDAVAGASEYRAYVSQTSGSGYFLWASGFTGTSATLYSLTGNYYVVVRAVVGGVESASSNEVLASADGTVTTTTTSTTVPATTTTTTTTAPSSSTAPANLTVTDRTASTVGLRWDAVAGASEYRAYVSRTSGSGYFLWASGFTGTSATLYSLTGDFYVVVRAVVGGVESASSNEVLARAP